MGGMTEREIRAALDQGATVDEIVEAMAIDARARVERVARRRANECSTCGAQIPGMASTLRNRAGDQIGLECLACREERDPGALARALDHPNIGMRVVEVPPIGRED